MKDFFSPDCALGSDRIDYLSLMISVFFLGGPTLRRALHPARGRWAGKVVLGDYVPEAYFICRKLMDDSRLDSVVRDLITKALGGLSERDHKAKRYLDRAKKVSGGDIFSDREAMNLAVVCLVYRAFHGAWQRYKINGLPEWKYAAKKYLYGSKLPALYSKLEDLHPATFRTIGQEWKDLYLVAAPGAAAKARRII